MAAYLDFPFTHAQWKELHRQAMIYKYMMASVPVPPDLLFSTSRSLYHPAASCSPWAVSDGGFNLRNSRGGLDPEPGRCRRTDGKKWRCSRDAAPDKKYCERHMKRGRPRSRKPVEVKLLDNVNDNNNVNNKTKKACQSHILPVSPVASPTEVLGTASLPYGQKTVFQDNKVNEKLVAFPSSSTTSLPQESRRLNWMFKEPVFASHTQSQQWEHMMQLKTGLSMESEFPFSSINASVLQQDIQEHPFIHNCTHFGDPEDEKHNKFTYFNLSPVSSDRSQSSTSRGFIDAWSNAVSDDQYVDNANKNCSVSLSSGNLPLSSLTLSMGGSNTEEHQMGLNIAECNQDKDRSGTKTNFSSLLPSDTWTCSTPGGPLAEALGPKTAGDISTIVGEDSNLNVMLYEGSSDSPAVTRVSSPSGVLYKTVVAFSDSSRNSSPTTLREF